MSERNDTGPGHGGSHPFDEEFNSHRRDGEDHSAHSQGPDGNEDGLDRTGDSDNSTSDSDATGADEHEVLEGEIDDRDEWQRRFDDLVSDLDPPPDISYATSGVGPHAPPDPRDEPTLLERWDQELPPDADEEETYEPPPPPPIPWPSLPGLAGFFSVVAGILIFVRPEWLPFGTAGGRMVGFMVFVTGVALLISRLREEPEEDERPDDGAVV